MGPVLFLVFLNDLPDSIGSVCRIFADDAKIYRPISDAASDFPALQDHFDSSSEWSRAWQLGVAHDKSTVFQVNFHHQCFLRVDGHRLNTDALNVRHLGVHFSNDLNWSFGALP